MSKNFLYFNVLLKTPLQKWSLAKMKKEELFKNYTETDNTKMYEAVRKIKPL